MDVEGDPRSVKTDQSKPRKRPPARDGNPLDGFAESVAPVKPVPLKKKSSEKKKKSSEDSTKKSGIPDVKNVKEKTGLMRQITGTAVNKESLEKAVLPDIKSGVSDDQARAAALIHRRRQCEPNYNYLTDDIYRSFFEKRPVEYVAAGPIRVEGTSVVLPARDKVNLRNVNLIFYENESNCWREYKEALLELPADEALNFGRGGILVRSR